jgi:hypothetical protein
MHAQALKLQKRIKTLCKQASFLKHKELDSGYWSTANGDRDLLHQLRSGLLRHEQRASYLAYGYIRGVPYSRVEENPRWIRTLTVQEPDWIKVRDIVWKFTSSPSSECLSYVGGVKQAKDILLKKILEWAV